MSNEIVIAKIKTSQLPELVSNEIVIAKLKTSQLPEFQGQMKLW